MSSLAQSFVFSFFGLWFTGSGHFRSRVFYFDGAIVRRPVLKKIDRPNYFEVAYAVQY
jgi:hypothetical protein